MIKLHDALADLQIAATADLRAAGVQSRDIAAAIEDGRLFRVAPGLVATADAYADPRLDDAVACHRTGGVIAHLSAAMRHDLCDALPPRLEVLVHFSTVRAPAGLAVRLIRTRSQAALSVGVQVEDFHGLPIRITDPARTIVDLYRIDPGATRQHALAALTRYLRDGHDAAQLQEYAAVFGVAETLRPEIEVVMETLDQGMRP